MRTFLALLLTLLALNLPAAETFTNLAAHLASSTTAGYKPLSQHGQSVNMESARWLHKAIEAGGPITLAAFGDSVGDAKLSALKPWLWSQFGSNGFGMEGFGVFQWTTAGACTNKLPLTDAAATNAWWNYNDLGNGGSITWTPSVWSDRIEVFYVQRPGAGSFKIQTSTNGAAFADATNVTATGTYGGAWVTLAVPLGLWSVKVVGTGATIPILGASIWNSTGSGVRLIGLANGGINWAHVQQVHTNVSVPILGHLNPSAWFVEEKSDGSHHGTYWPMLLQLRSMALTNADWIVIGTTPVETDDATYSVAQNAVDRAWCVTNGLPYFDGYSPVQSFGNMTNAFGYTDGSHPTAAAQTFIGMRLMHELGLGSIRPRTNAVVINNTTTTTFNTNNPIFTGEVEIKGSGGALNIYDRTTAGTYDRHVWLRDNGKLKLYDTPASSYVLNIFTSGGQNLTPDTTLRGTPFNLGLASDPFILTSTNTVLLGSTNVVTYGGTNVAPVTTAAPKLWISVRVNGLTNAFRLPIYE